MTPEKIDAAVSRLVAAPAPQPLIAQRCAQACGYGSGATGDLLVIQGDVADR
jgi:hypothetical protein